jgi:NAD(P)-dependent dehydrogenase (short-subunit alcohol dehydrogenase family)
MLGQDVSTYQAAWEAATGRGQAPVAPRIVLDPRIGLCSLGRSAGEAGLAGRLYRQLIDILLHATSLGGYEALPLDQAIAAAERADANAAGDGYETGEFAGEIALITGGASGIGKACVASVLARGAAVVNLDVNPAVTTLYDRPDYLGLQCDLTDETAVLRCFDQFARTFGGLDMLVLNAGIFPSSCRIESLALDHWQQVMRINLDSNLVLLREAHGLLKRSPRGGRVVVNASKNVPAPGAGAAAYSASKAALTQLARVAALEWGKDHIRLNQIHPDAIFDTGIWSEEVLQARAAHYGMTVQQYKTRNVLGVELNSRFVGELVAEMLGPRFEKITGAQIPVDGGSDRVI